MNPSKQLIETLVGTAEIMGGELSLGSARIMLDDLEGFSEDQILAALKRVRQERSGKLTLSDIVDRIDDGRPGPQEAWAMCPMNEKDTVVWTSEIEKAFNVAYPLLSQGDKIGARMAFLEAYKREIQLSRSEKRKVKWVISLGHDITGREHPVVTAVEKGLIESDYAKSMVPSIALIGIPQLRLSELMQKAQLMIAKD